MGGNKRKSSSEDKVSVMNKVKGSNTGKELLNN